MKITRRDPRYVNHGHTGSKLEAWAFFYDKAWDNPGMARGLAMGAWCEEESVDEFAAAVACEILFIKNIEEGVEPDDAHIREAIIRGMDPGEGCNLRIYKIVPVESGEGDDEDDEKKFERERLVDFWVRNDTQADLGRIKMKVIIKREKYDTTTAEKVACCKNPDILMSDRWANQVLYRKKTGKYFLFEEPTFAYMGNKIIPLTEDEAKDWVEEHHPAMYEDIFGEVEE